MHNENYTVSSCLFDVSKKQELSLDVSCLAALQQYSFAVTVLSGPWNQQVCWDESSPVYCQGADVPICESLHRLTYLERILKKKNFIKSSRWPAGNPGRDDRRRSR